MIDQRAKPRIIMVIEDGLVTGVYGDNLPTEMMGIDVIKLDYDTEGSAPEDGAIPMEGSTCFFDVLGLEKPTDEFSTAVGRAYFEWGLT